MNKFWSDVTKNLSPYVPGEQPQDQTYIKLNTNENPFPPSEMAVKAINNNVSDSLRLYPDPEAKKLITAIAEYYNIDKNKIFVSNGSDEVLAFSFLAFFKNNNAITFPNITYSFYPVYCNLYNIEFNNFPLNENFEIDISEIPENSGGIIFPNPNAPTGLYLGIEAIEEVLIKNPNVVVIIDEAYIDFGGISAIQLSDKYPNLLIIQTFSKSRSLAGLRVGFAIGHQGLIEGLNRVKNSFNSYPLDTLAIEGSVAAIQDDKYFKDGCEKIIKIRNWVEKELKSISFYVLPSKANFLFVKHAEYDAEILYRELKNKGILVRHFNAPKISDFLRISIGTEDEMRIFIKELQSIVVQNSI